MRKKCRKDVNSLISVQPNGNPADDGFLGMGIDAGGTYTDAVIYDTGRRQLLGKSKSLTTKWDYAAGIVNAIAGLDRRHFPDVKMVALSTTLATNAIVEGDGQKVGMIIMPPYGLLQPEEIPYRPMAVISGQMEIDGTEIAPAEVSEARDVARRMVTRDGVQAFAVSGFAGSVNPAHELAVKAAIQEETGCAVTCGHELSDLLNFKTRAYTAMFNARLIPRLLRLLRSLEAVLGDLGIRAPIVVVKGDGTLMSAEAAVARPVETILSGPAASVSGARHLTGINDALVLDMGGTTTDTAALEDGAVSISAAGSSVGGSHTHVKALTIRTVGLGGDSLIHWDLSGFAIGPRRVAPVSWTGFHDPETAKALDFIEQSPEQYTSGAVNMLQVLSLSSEPPEELRPTARRVLSILRTRPFTIAELIDRAEAAYEGALEIATLEARGIIGRSGPTPMDLLHFAGRFTEWDRSLAERYLRLMAHLVGKEPEEMVDGLLRTVIRRMTLELLKRQLDDVIDDPEAIDRCPVCNAILENIFAGDGRHWAAEIHLKRPVIGIGAPVGFFLPQAAAFLNAEVIIPDHADVANAIGAITSQVVVTRRLRIVAEQDRTFAIQGMAGTRRFTGLSEADGFARNVLTRMVIQEGRTAGTRSDAVRFFVEDQTLTATDGSDLFKWRIITARLSGAPDLALANTADASGQKQDSTATSQKVQVDDTLY